MLIEERLLQELKKRGYFLASVESCTGGLIASRLTSIPGSSESFWGALVVYDNSAKTALAGLNEDLITRLGAVSPEVAQELAEGGLSRLKGARDARGWICVSTTGIAGPGGGTPAKPVGLCYCAVSIQKDGGGPKPESSTRVLEVRPPSGEDKARDRRFHQNRFADAAFELALEALKTH